MWQHYRYTLDNDYLRRAFAAMKGASLFWVDRMVLAADGTYECPNEYSPEHGPGQENAAAHAQQIVRECLSNTIQAAHAMALNLESLERYEEALPIREELYRNILEQNGPKDQKTLYQRLYAADLTNLGKYEEAYPLWQSLYCQYRKLHGISHPATMNATDNLAKILLAFSNYDEAVSLFEDLYAGCKSAYGPGERETLYALKQLAQTLKDALRFEEALARWKELYDSILPLTQPDSNGRLLILNRICNCVSYLDAQKEALHYTSEFYRGNRSRYGENDNKTQLARSIYRDALLKYNQFQTGLELFQNIYDWFEKQIGPQEPATLQVLEDLITFMLRLDMDEEAEKLKSSTRQESVFDLIDFTNLDNQ
jgi:tetratricopeptide (TPR) repeat protein